MEKILSFFPLVCKHGFSNNGMNPCFGPLEGRVQIWGASHFLSHHIIQALMKGIVKRIFS
eukprot:c25381_g3_i2 orf=348-527(+)